VTLADLQPGDEVVIESIDATDPVVQRLMVLGLVEETVLTFVRRSIGGDPLEFELCGAGISLRRQQAARFRVRRINGQA
jgi:Fe2+ transport system protein FeoA